MMHIGCRCLIFPLFDFHKMWCVGVYVCITESQTKYIPIVHPSTPQLEVPHKQVCGLGCMIWPQPGMHGSPSRYLLLFQYCWASLLAWWCPIHQIWGCLEVRMWWGPSVTVWHTGCQCTAAQLYVWVCPQACRLSMVATSWIVAAVSQWDVLAPEHDLVD